MTMAMTALLLAVAVAPTPAQRRIALAEQAIARDSSRHQSYNELALAFTRRARETSDPAYYERALGALEESFRLAPDNLEGQRVRAWVLLGRHEFARAFEVAKALNRRAPDDLMGYALLVDAHVELGQYAEAESAAQWLLDLRPGNVPGQTRAAYLRELFGDVEGAVELMNGAFEQIPPAEVEERAWVLTQIAHLRLSRGGLAQAEALLAGALELFPDYHYALAQLAKLRASQGRAAEAIELLRRRHAAAPHPENLYDLACALNAAGRDAEARSAFTEFERKARAESDGADNANRELIFYYLDHARRPEEALRLARLEAGRRRDVHTLDAYAWALKANGRNAEARGQIEAALAVGWRDASALYRAGAIALAAGDRAAARRYLSESLALNPLSERAAVAQTALRKLEPSVSR